MNCMKNLVLALALALGGALALVGTADAGFEQSYSSWHRAPNYYYRYYHYAPSAYHYVIYYPQSPRYLYYYSPTSKVYWGRFDVQLKGYSLLAEADRKGVLKDIPESKFPEPGEMPAVPESKEGERVLAPSADDLPGDLPPGEELKKKDEKVAAEIKEGDLTTDPKPNPDGVKPPSPDVGVVPKPDVATPEKPITPVTPDGVPPTPKPGSPATPDVTPVPPGPDQGAPPKVDPKVVVPTTAPTAVDPRPVPEILKCPLKGYERHY